MQSPNKMPVRESLNRSICDQKKLPTTYLEPYYAKYGQSILKYILGAPFFLFLVCLMCEKANGVVTIDEVYKCREIVKHQKKCLEVLSQVDCDRLTHYVSFGIGDLNSAIITTLLPPQQHDVVQIEVPPIEGVGSNPRFINVDRRFFQHYQEREGIKHEFDDYLRSIQVGINRNGRLMDRRDMTYDQAIRRDTFVFSGHATKGSIAALAASYFKKKKAYILGDERIAEGNDTSVIKLITFNCSPQPNGTREVLEEILGVGANNIVNYQSRLRLENIFGILSDYTNRIPGQTENISFSRNITDKFLENSLAENGVALAPAWVLSKALSDYAKTTFLAHYTYPSIIVYAYNFLGSILSTIDQSEQSSEESMMKVLVYGSSLFALLAVLTFSQHNIPEQQSIPLLRRR